MTDVSVRRSIFNDCEIMPCGCFRYHLGTIVIVVPLLGVGFAAVEPLSTDSSPTSNVI